MFELIKAFTCNISALQQLTNAINRTLIITIVESPLLALTLKQLILTLKTKKRPATSTPKIIKKRPRPVRRTTYAPSLLSTYIPFPLATLIKSIQPPTTPSRPESLLYNNAHFDKA